VAGGAGVGCDRRIARPTSAGAGDRGRDRRPWGKRETTLAQTLADAATKAGEQAEVLHTDDIAWNQARFDWDRLLIEHVLAPAHDGRAVDWRPPAWISHGRPGGIEVPAATTVLFVEGTGAARRQLAPWIDVAVWVQADLDIAHHRGITRDCAAHHRTRGDAQTAWDSWMTEELPHLADDRPWERADLIVAGTDVAVRGHDADIVIAERSPLLHRHRPPPTELPHRDRG
jgi:hypothetical protein